MRAVAGGDGCSLIGRIDANMGSIGEGSRYFDFRVCIQIEVAGGVFAVVAAVAADYGVTLHLEGGVVVDAAAGAGCGIAGNATANNVEYGAVSVPDTTATGACKVVGDGAVGYFHGSSICLVSDAAGAVGAFVAGDGAAVKTETTPAIIDATGIESVIAADGAVGDFKQKAIVIDAAAQLFADVVADDAVLDI